jgi:hypothetical protein
LEESAITQLGTGELPLNSFGGSLGTGSIELACPEACGAHSIRYPGALSGKKNDLYESKA